MSLPITEDVSWPELQRVRRAIVVVDVVESVRLMQAYEADVIDRWRRFVHEVRTQVLPGHGGRMVKSLGDGMLLEFESVPEAAKAALDIQRRVVSYNRDCPPERAVWLRVGAHVGEIVIDDIDIFGEAVNVSARIASLAKAGQCVCSVEFRDDLTPGLDADIDDLGDCYLKHIEAPLRCFSFVSTNGTSFVPAVPASAIDAELLPGIAVLPFAVRGGVGHEQALGDALCDDIIAALSNRRQWRVISRLSTAPFRGGATSLVKTGASLRAGYVIDGTCVFASSDVRVNVSLTEVRSGVALWTVSHRLSVAALFAGEDGLVPEVVERTARAVADVEIRRARTLPVHSLEAYSLYLAGSNLLNRLGATDFGRARELLDHVAARVPRSAAPHAMVAKWHVMRMTQGWASDPLEESGLARSFARRALQLEPDHAYALAVDGLVAVQADKDLVTARRQYFAALDADPQEAYAWAALSGLHCYCDEPDEAVSAARQAVALSPLDPARFMYESYLAMALLRAGLYAQALEAAQRSLRLNRCLSATYRILAIAQVMSGQAAAACATVDQLLVYEPAQTLRAYRLRYPGRDSAHMQDYLSALREAGVPE
jgi:adenylate cyclase